MFNNAVLRVYLTGMRACLKQAQQLKATAVKRIKRYPANGILAA
jgi:hypothetical protein